MRRSMVDLNSIGIDEVGRWPLAWPVSVGGVFCLPEFAASLPDRYHDVTDSKKLSAHQRKILAQKILLHPALITSIHSSRINYIDQHGIIASLRRASVAVITDIFQQLKILWYTKVPSILLDGNNDFWIKKKIFRHDGSLRGAYISKNISIWSSEYSLEENPSLQTIVHGDQLVWQISAASIIAKVRRDDYMIVLSNKRNYKVYWFDRHKWYGTLFHRNMIQRYWLSDQHRKSYCRNITPIS